MNYYKFYFSSSFNNEKVLDCIRIKIIKRFSKKKFATGKKVPNVQ